MTDTDHYVLTEVRDGTGHIVLNRPRQLNALTAMEILRDQPP